MQKCLDLHPSFCASAPCFLGLFLHFSRVGIRLVSNQPFSQLPLGQEGEYTLGLPWLDWGNSPKKGVGAGEN